MWNEIQLKERFEKALEQAEQKLESLDVACGRPKSLNGLNGWVFEQTIRTCLEEELKERGICADIQEQVPIGGRAKVDLLVNGKVAIEVKAGGFFGGEGPRYAEYRERLTHKRLDYLYLTLYETHQPYVEVARTIFGPGKAFFLDKAGSWTCFVSTVQHLLNGRT